MNDLPSTPIEYLKGVGPQKAALLSKEMEIHNYGDLLFHFPYRYVDRSYFTKIKDLHYEDSYVHAAAAPCAARRRPSAAQSAACGSAP